MRARLTNRERKRLRLVVSHQPNRRFRPRWPSLRGEWRHWLTPKHLILALTATVVIAIPAAERFPEYTGKLAFWTATRTVTGRVTHVRDGDTIEVSGTPIRFGSLDCAERGTFKGRQATNRMRRLIQGQRLTCALNGRRSYDRFIGSCRLSDGRDLAGVMIREGYCGRYW